MSAVLLRFPGIFLWEFIGFMGVSHVHVQQTNPVRVNVLLLVFGAAALRWHGPDSAGGT